jgi:membrane-bound inhibitor of C-type lysozyme
MFNVLQARNITSKMVVYPDENHVSQTPLTYVCEESDLMLTFNPVGS